MTISPDPPPRPEADLLSAAVEYADQGIAIMPCVERGKKPALPRTGKEHADSDQRALTRFANGGRRNPQLQHRYRVHREPASRHRHRRTEAGSRVDTRQPDAYAENPDRDHRLEGWHYYYRWPEGVTVKTCQIADPSSRSVQPGPTSSRLPQCIPDGHIYQWAPERGDWDDWDALPEPPPEWIALHPGARHLDNVVPALEGGNAVALKRLAGLADTSSGET